MRKLRPERFSNYPNIIQLERDRAVIRIVASQQLSKACPSDEGHSTHLPRSLWEDQGLCKLQSAPSTLFDGCFHGNIGRGTELWVHLGAPANTDRDSFSVAFPHLGAREQERGADGAKLQDLLFMGTKRSFLFF